MSVPSRVVWAIGLGKGLVELRSSAKVPTASVTAVEVPCKRRLPGWMDQFVMTRDGGFQRVEPSPVESKLNLKVTHWKGGRFLATVKQRRFTKVFGAIKEGQVRQLDRTEGLTFLKREMGA